MKKINLAFTLLLITIVLSCKSENKSYRITGTFFKDCEQTLPVSNTAGSIEIDYIKGGKVQNATFPFTTDSEGHIDLLYESPTSKAYDGQNTNTMNLIGFIDGVPHGQNVDLGQITINMDLEFFISVNYSRAFNETDTIWVKPAIVDSFIPLTSPFNDTIIGPFHHKNSFGIPIYSSVNTVFYNMAADAFINSKTSGEQHRGLLKINNCDKKQTINIEIK